MISLKSLKSRVVNGVDTRILNKIPLEKISVITVNTRGNMKELKFMNPVFKTGINVTVRRGTKWSGTDNEYVSIINTNQNINKKGKILLTKCKRFKDITEEDIENEHDPVCRTTNGLYKVMKRTYPDFGKNEIITIVKFEVSD